MKITDYSKKSKIIDRDDEIQSINNRILNSNKSRVFVIHANTGIGKTSLTKKLMYDMKIEGYDYFRIATAPHNKNDNSAEWLFVDEIFNAIQTYFNKPLYDNCLSFKNYLSNDHNKLVQSLADNEFISDIAPGSSITGATSLISIAYSSIKSSIKRFANLGPYNPYATIYDNTSLARSIKTEYIRYVFSSAKCILIIENLQNIDYISLKYLLDWINDTKNNVHGFIFEYTTSDEESLLFLDSLIHRLTETNAYITKIELEKIEKKYVLQVIDVNIENKPTDICFNVDALKHFDSYSNGNLWDLLDYTRTYEESKKAKREIIKPTLEKFIRLSNEAKAISYVCFYYSGKILREKLFVIYNDFFYSNNDKKIETVLSELHKKEIIEPDDSKYIIFAHASVTDVIAESINSNLNIYQAVYMRLTDIFKRCYIGTLNIENKEFAWHMLLKLYVDNEPNKISELFDDFISNIMDTISTKNAWLYIKAFIIYTEKKISELLVSYYKILKVCFKTFLYNEGFWCLQKMEKYVDVLKNDQLLLYKMLYLSVLDKHQEVIEIYQSNIKTTKIYSKKWINLNLIVLNCYIEKNRKDVCLKIHKELSETPNLKNYAEYPYFLRLSNIYLPYKKALKNAKKSIKIFAKYGDIEQEGKSLITYSKLLSSLGKNRRAINNIIKAKDKLSNSHIGYACIYNNLAGYLLLNGKSGPEIWNYLDFAEQYSITVYDKLSVIINKLAWCIENKSFDRIDLLENKAKKYIEKEPSKLIHCTTYYNLYIVMKKNHNNKKANEYYDKFYSLKDFCPYIQARFSGLNSQNKYLKHRISKPYHICYLSFWTYDLDWDKSSS